LKVKSKKLNVKGTKFRYLVISQLSLLLTKVTQELNFTNFS